MMRLRRAIPRSDYQLLVSLIGLVIGMGGVLLGFVVAPADGLLLWVALGLFLFGFVTVSISIAMRFADVFGKFWLWLSKR